MTERFDTMVRLRAEWNQAIADYHSRIAHVWNKHGRPSGTDKACAAALWPVWQLFLYDVAAISRRVDVANAKAFSHLEG